MGMVVVSCARPPPGALHKAYQIPGGAEAIMDDYAARAAVKMARKLAKL